MNPKTRTTMLAFAVVAVFAVTVWLVSLTHRLEPLPPLPNPNGYDDLIRAAELVTGQLDDYRAATKDELHVHVAINAEALAQLRVGLSRECRAPLKVALADATETLPALKRLAGLLAVEGWLAELEHRPGDAARSYVDAIHLGHEISRGGFMIHHLVGLAGEAIGFSPLVKLVPTLTTEQARSTLTELDKLDATRVTWDEVQRHEQYFTQHALATTVRPVVRPLARVAGWWQTRESVRKTKEKHDRAVAGLRLLAAELALRCFQAERGRVPSRLDELVPAYLGRVPQDPFASQPLVYRAHGTNWLLYSVGPDGRDDSGASVGHRTPGVPRRGDLLFDSPW